MIMFVLLCCRDWILIYSYKYHWMMKVVVQDDLRKGDLGSSVFIWLKGVR